MKYDIHDYAGRHECEMRSLARAEILEKHKDAIRAFDRHLAVLGMSIPRRTKYLSVLKVIARQLGKISFEGATKEDITDLVCWMQESNYTEWTKKSYKSMLKRFYKWLKGNDEEFPPEVAWVRTTLPRSKRPLPKTEELLTEEEAKKLVEAADNVRDKALVAVLWESGARIGEIGSQRVGGTKFDKYGAVVMMDGKTGPRPVRLINSAPLLADWLNSHPCRSDKDAPLWVRLATGRGDLLGYRGITRALEKLFLRAGVKKRYNPHIFRHSRATFLANYLTEFQMNQYFGWVQGSDMPSTYVHLSGKDTDKALLKLYGMSSDGIQQQNCVCGKEIDAGSRFCADCGAELPRGSETRNVTITAHSKPENEPESLPVVNAPVFHTVC